MRAGEATARARKMSRAYDADGGRRPRRLRQCTSGAPTASHFRRLRVHFGNHDRDRALRHVAAGDVGAQDVGAGTVHHTKSCRRPYSITSSARASSVGGTSRPRALAVLRLSTSSFAAERRRALVVTPCRLNKRRTPLWVLAQLAFVETIRIFSVQHIRCHAEDNCCGES
jgi:hypothetical protein